MTTSKVKTVKSVSEPWGTNGILWHLLEMENGDKINIGKMKKQNVGDELTYVINGEGHEYNKAKSVNPNNFNSGTRGSFTDNSDKQKVINRWAGLGRAIDYLQGTKATEEQVYQQAQRFIDWATENNTQKKADTFDQRLTNKISEITNPNTRQDEDDLPF